MLITCGHRMHGHLGMMISVGMCVLSGNLMKRLCLVAVNQMCVHTSKLRHQNDGAKQYRDWCGEALHSFQSIHTSPQAEKRAMRSPRINVDTTLMHKLIRPS